MNNLKQANVIYGDFLKAMSAQLQQNMNREQIEAYVEALRQQVPATLNMVESVLAEPSAFQRALDNFSKRHPHYAGVSCYNIAEEIWLLTYNDDRERCIETKVGDSEAEAIETLNIL